MNTEIKKLVNTIENDDLKALAEEMVKTIPDYFYEVPASSTGKYHPNYTLGKGGLLRHTVAVVKILNYLLEVTDEFTSRERDLLRIAAIMHDTRKSGSQREFEVNSYSRFEHPLLAAAQIRRFKNREYNDVEVERIAKVVECHMGKWNTSEYTDLVLPVPQDKFQTMLHQADYLASRKDIEIQFTDYMPEKEKTVNRDIVIFPFGKYKGQGINEIAVNDRQYLEWVLSNMTLRDNLRKAVEDALMD